MSKLELTKTKLRQGVWEGVITGAGDSAPNIRVTHQTQPVEGLDLAHNPEQDHWRLTVPIPAEAIADGVQTLIVQDADAGVDLGHVTLMAGEVLGDDIRVEMELLRAELDMLKRAFRRHCTETA